MFRVLKHAGRGVRHRVGLTHTGASLTLGAIMSTSSAWMYSGAPRRLSTGRAFSTSCRFTWSNSVPEGCTESGRGTSSAHQRHQECHMVRRAVSSAWSAASNVHARRKKVARMRCSPWKVATDGGFLQTADCRHDLMSAWMPGTLEDCSAAGRGLKLPELVTCWREECFEAQCSRLHQRCEGGAVV